MSKIPPLPPFGKGHSGAFIPRTGVNYSRGFAHMPWYYRNRHPVAFGFFAFGTSVRCLDLRLPHCAMFPCKYASYYIILTCPPFALSFFPRPPALLSWDPFLWTERGRARAARAQIRDESLALAGRILARKDSATLEPRVPCRAALEEQELLLAPVVIPSVEERELKQKFAEFQKKHADLAIADAQALFEKRQRAEREAEALEQRRTEALKAQGAADAARFAAEQEQRAAAQNGMYGRMRPRFG
jgi:hypothetical protein